MNEKKISQQAIDITLRLILLFGVLYWCFQIIYPFIMPVLWGLIIAIATNPIQQFFEEKFRLKPKLAAALIVFLLLASLLIPAILFFSSVTQVIIEWKSEIEQGVFVLPPIPKFIENWPFVGEKLHDFLSDINANLETFLEKYQSQILEASKKLLQIIVGTGLNILQIFLSIIIAGVLLAMGDRNNFSFNLFNRLIGKEGHSYVTLSVQTIRNVVKGVLGVAAIQTLLAGIGLSLSGIPHAPVWALICLVLAIVQVGPGLVLIAASLYLFDQESMWFASMWSLFFVGVAISDNILKPILLGKGASVPMMVIFLGVVGGFLLSGFIGLFTGAIILSIGYKLFIYWLEHDNNKPFIEEESPAEIHS